MGICPTCQGVDFDNLPPLPAHYEGYHSAWKKDSGLIGFLSLRLSEAIKAGKDVDAGEFSQQLGVAHHQSIDELRAAAEYCPICRLIERGVSQDLAARAEAAKDEVFVYYQKKRDKKGPDHRLWLTRRRDDCDGFMVVSSETNDLREVWLLAAIGFCVEDDDPLSTSIPGRVIQEDSASRTILARASQFVHECNAQHAGTRCIAGEVELPSRVLDVEYGSSPSRLRLFEPEGTLGKYIALSHRWGDERPFATTRSNLGPYKAQGINVENLPKTFQDAVVMARRLGIRYLWIDALCICQDDGPEWERESAKMAVIYSHAYLVLAATGSERDSGGIFNQRSPPDYEGVEHSKNGARGTLKAFLIPKRWAARPDGYCMLNEEPLSERGWALQERLLASRTLHFGSTQMFFECYGHFRSEDGFRMRGRLNSIHNDPHQHYPLADPDSSLRSSLYRGSELWYQALYFYYPRKLTKSSDKLPALSGIARIVEEQTGDKYVAGLWHSTLIEGLIWQAAGTHRNATSAPPGYRAPSWSWASIDGPFGNLGLGRDPIYKGAEWVDIATVIDVHIELKGENPYGEVASGWLKIKAPIEPLAPSEEKEPDWETVPHKRALRMKTRAGKTFGTYSMLDTLDDESASQLTLFALVLVFMDGKEGRTYQAIVVTPVEGQDGYYRRVGKMIMDDESLGKCAWMESGASLPTVTLL